jgi:hypothetical protein
VPGDRITVFGQVRRLSDVYGHPIFTIEVDSLIPGDVKWGQGCSDRVGPRETFDLKWEGVNSEILEGSMLPFSGGEKDVI